MTLFLVINGTSAFVYEIATDAYTHETKSVERK